MGDVALKLSAMACPVGISLNKDLRPLTGSGKGIVLLLSVLSSFSFSLSLEEMRYRPKYCPRSHEAQTKGQSLKGFKFYNRRTETDGKQFSQKAHYLVCV